MQQDKLDKNDDDYGQTSIHTKKNIVCKRRVFIQPFSVKSFSLSVDRLKKSG